MWSEYNDQSSLLLLVFTRVQSNSEVQGLKFNNFA